jgi:serine/threonine protein kinase
MLFASQDDKKKVDEQQLKLWLAEILLALKHCHDNNVLHRDIKTSNLFLTADLVNQPGPMHFGGTHIRAITIMLSELL